MYESVKNLQVPKMHDFMRLTTDHVSQFSCVESCIRDPGLIPISSQSSTCSTCFLSPFWKVKVMPIKKKTCLSPKYTLFHHL